MKIRFICTAAAIVIFSFILLAFTAKPGVKLTFKNDSGEMFKTLDVNVVGKKFHFENLRAGAQTKAILVESCHRYCYAKAVTAKDTVICQPEDFVGEALLTSGELTMHLQIKTYSGSRFLEIK